MACTGIGPYTWYLYNSDWALIDCVDTSSTQYTFEGITTAGTYNVLVVSESYTATTQFIITGNETCCWDSSIYQPCNEGCYENGGGISVTKGGEDFQFTINQNYGSIGLFFQKLNDSLGFNSASNINSRPLDISVLYSSEANKGSNVYFQSLLRSYECCSVEPDSDILFTAPCINEPTYKVLRFCNTCDTNHWISGYSFNYCTSCCPDGYVLDPDGETCYYEVTTAATSSLITYTSYTGSQVITYNNGGTRFYCSQLTGNLPYIITGDTTTMYDVVNNEINYDLEITDGPIWFNSGDTNNGRLNSVGIWGTLGAPNPNLPVNEWIGVSHCISAETTSRYCVGLAADNKSRLKIDGEIFFTSEFSDYNNSNDFLVWKVFEVELSSGKHIIEFEGLNAGIRASLGCEIYDVGIETLSGFTSEADLIPVTLFSTADLRSDVIGDITSVFGLGENSGNQCPTGYSLDSCASGSPICTLISRTDCDTLQCLDNWDIRFLAYSGNCDYRELIEFDPNSYLWVFNNNCIDNQHPYTECGCFYVAIGYRGDDINDHYSTFNLFLTDKISGGLKTLSYNLRGRASINYPTTTPTTPSLLGGVLPSQTVQNIEGNCPIKPSCNCLTITTGDNENDNGGYPSTIGGLPFYEFEKSYTIFNRCYTEFNLYCQSEIPAYTGLTIDASEFNGVLGKNETATLRLSYISSDQVDVIGSVNYSATTYDPFICSDNKIECPGTLDFNFVAKPVPLVISNSTYNFGNIGNGCCGINTFIIQNTGSIPITISALSLTNPFFSILDPEQPMDSQQSLGIGGKLSVRINFCPTGCTDGTIHTSDLLIITTEYGVVNGSSTSSGFGISGACVNPTISASTDSFVFIKMVDDEVFSAFTICNRTGVEQTVDVSNCIQFFSGTTTEITDPLNFGFEILYENEESIQNSVTYPRNVVIPENGCVDLNIGYNLLIPNKTFCSLYLRDDCGNVTEIPFTGYSLPYPIVEVSKTYANPRCYNETNGSITITFSGGSNPYNYIFSGGSVYESGTIFTNTITFNGLSAETTGTDYIFYLSGNPCDGSYIIPDLSPFVTSTSPEVILNTPIVTTLMQPQYFQVVETDYTGKTCVALGSVSVSVIGGTDPYIFTWSNGTIQTGFTTPHTTVLSGLDSGTYGVTALDFNGCVITTNVTIPSLLPISINPVVTPVSCYCGFDGSAFLNVNGAMDPVTYLWSGVTHNGYEIFPSHTDTYTSTTANNLTAGTYNVSYIDGNGCDGYTVFNVPQPNNLYFDVNGTDVTCSYLTNGIINFISITGGTYPYRVYASGITTTYSSTTQTISGVDSGIYDTYVIDKNGCETEHKSLTITKPDPFGVTYEYTASTCFNSYDGQILVTITGGTAPYYFSWTPSVGSTNHITNLLHGNYSVDIFDSNGCSISTGFTLPFVTTHCGDLRILDENNNELPFIDGIYQIQLEHTCLNTTSEKEITLCQNSPCAFNIIGYSGISTNVSDFYLGAEINQITIPSSGCTSINVVFNPTSTQTYNKVFGITTEYCTHYLSLSGTGVENIISASTTNINFGGVCFGTGKTEYLTLLNLTPDNRAITIQTVPSEFTTTYGTFVLSGNSTISVPYVFTPTYQNSNPTLWEHNFSGSSKITNCPTLEIVLSGSGYGGNVWISGVDFGCVNKNCYLDKITTIYNEHCLPVSISAITIPSYYSNAVSVLGFTPTVILPGGTLPVTVRYSATTTMSTYIAAETDFSLAAIIISGLTGCMVDTLNTIDIIQPIVTVPGIPTSTTVNVTNTTLTNLFIGANITDSTGGTPTYLTVSPPILPLPAPISPITGITNTFTIQFNNLDPVNGLFYLNLQDNCGNQKSLPFFVASNPIGVENFESSGPLCHGQNNGTITITPSGGTEPYTIVWDSGITGDTIINLSAGTYNATIYDAIWNSSTFSFVLNEPDTLGITHTIPFNGFVNIYSYGDNSGYVNLSVSGGSAPYHYFWSGYTYLGEYITSNNSNLTGLTSGNYLVSVTDNNGCVINDFISLTQPQPLSVVITNCSPPVPPAVYCVFSGGTAEMVISGGQGPYSVLVCPTTPQNPFFGVGGVYYGLTSCQLLPPCSGVTSGTPCVEQICYCCDNSLAPCYSASCPITLCEVIVNNLPSGTYPPGTFLIVDSNSATTTYNAQTFIPNLSTLGFNLSQTQTTCGGQSNGSITANIIPTINQLGQYGTGVPPYIYFLNGYQYGLPTTAMTQTFTGLTSALYTVGVQDSDLNFVSHNVFVNQGKLSSVISTTSETNQNTNGSIIINQIIGGVGPYYVSLNSNPPVLVYDGYSFNNLPAGSYLFEMTDSLGCQFTVKPVINRIIVGDNEQIINKTKPYLLNNTIYEKRLGGFKLINKKK